MQPDEFKNLCQKAGLGEVKEEKVDEGDQNPLYVEFGDGHELWYSLAMSGDQWIVHPRFSGVTLDKGYKELSRNDIRVENGKLVIEGVSGTKSKDFGYGVSGFSNATVRIDKHGVEVMESSSY